MCPSASSADSAGDGWPLHTSMHSFRGLTTDPQPNILGLILHCLVTRQRLILRQTESFHKTSQIQTRRKAGHCTAPKRHPAEHLIVRTSSDYWMKSGKGCPPAIGGRTEAVLWRESAATRLEWRQRGLLLQHMEGCSA